MQGIGSGRMVAAVLLVGAVLAVIGNALHPFLEAGASTEELLVTIGGEERWRVLHLLITAAVVLLAVGFAAVGRGLSATRGASLGVLASGFALIGGTLFAVQIGALDGVVMPALADAHAAAEDPAAVLATADALWAFDQALLGMVVAIYFGALMLTLGGALLRAGAFAVWLRYLAVATGAVGLIVGPMIVLDLGGDATFYTFRAVALAATVVAFGIAAQLWRGTALGPAFQATEAAGRPAHSR